MARSGSAAKKPIRWPYYKQMSFLKDTMTAKEMHLNLPSKMTLFTRHYSCCMLIVVLCHSDLQDTEVDDYGDNHSRSPTPHEQVSPSQASTPPVILQFHRAHHCLQQPLKEVLFLQIRNHLTHPPKYHNLIDEMQSREIQQILGEKNF